jgi:hypothetical protein
MARLPFRRILFAALLAAALSIAPAVMARADDAAVEQAAADKLMFQVVDYIAELLASVDAGANLVFDGVARATPGYGRVEMLFPKPEFFGGAGDGLRLEDVRATVTPFDELSYGFSVDLPNHAEFFDMQGAAEGRIEWRDSQLDGVWRSDLESATVLHGAFHELRASEIGTPPGEAILRLDTLELDQELSELSDGLWTGPFSVVLRALHITPPGDEITIALGGLSWRGGFDRIDLKAWQAFEAWAEDQPISADMIDPVGSPNPLPFYVQNPEEAVRILEAMTLGSGQSQLTLSDLAVEQSGEAPVRLTEATLSADYDNDRRPGEYGLSIGWRGLVDSDTELPPEVFTHSGSLRLRLERFPMRRIFIEALRQPETTDVMAAQDFVMPLILANRSALRLEELRLESSAAAVEATGLLTAEAESMMGAVGEARVAVAGLDRLIVIAAREALRDAEAQGVLAFLTIAKGLGRPEIAPDGKLAYIFDIVLPADGNITINDIPLDLILNSGEARLPGTESPLS